MAAVTPDRVRNRVKLTATDIPDAKVVEFIQDAEATIEAETGRAIDYSSCEQAEAAAITDLAAVYCLVHMSGGSAVGLSYTLGALRVEESSSREAPSPSILMENVLRLIERLRAPYVGRA